MKGYRRKQEEISSKGDSGGYKTSGIQNMEKIKTWKSGAQARRRRRRAAIVRPNELRENVETMNYAEK